MARQDYAALSQALAGAAASSSGGCLLVQDTAHRTSGTAPVRPAAALSLLAQLQRALAAADGGGGGNYAALQLLAVKSVEALPYPLLDDIAAALLNTAQQQCGGLAYEVAAGADPSSGDVAVDEASAVGRAAGGAMTLHLRWASNVRLDGTNAELRGWPLPGLPESAYLIICLLGQ